MCPTTSLLVDTAEGFRMMAHGDNDLAIGDKVTARFAPVRRPAGSLFRKSENELKYHCEERRRRSNPAFLFCYFLDCFAWLALTASRR